MTLLLSLLLLIGARHIPAYAQQPVTASSFYGSTYRPEYAVDGDPRTRWASRASGSSEWLQLDFGESVPIESLTIHWEASYAVEYEVQVSEDTRNWTVLRKKADGKEEKALFEGLGGRGRYLSIYCAKPLPPYNLYSIWEIESSDPPLRRALASLRTRAAEVRKAAAKEALRRLTPADTLPPASEGKFWTLVWHDEFDGYTLDESKWEVPDGAPRRGAWWMRDAISLDGNGNLRICSLKEGDRYVCGCVRTRGKFERAFGYYVARVKFQSQPGHWTAFWLYNYCTAQVGNEGRDGTEIDIFEKPWLDNRVHQALHWDSGAVPNVPRVPGIMEGFHTFALWWKPDEYVFYIDGRETWRTKAGGVCQAPLYVKLTDEIGDWAGDIRTARLPDCFTVDYVRVYDLE